MSEVDQRSEGGRLRRLLYRALTIAGTTAAGATVAWAVGTGVAAAAEHGPTGPSDTAPETAQSRVDGVGRDPSLLRSLAAATAARDAEAPPAERSTTSPQRPESTEHTEGTESEKTASGVVPRVTGAVGKLTHRVGAVLEPVGRAGDELLPGQTGSAVVDGVDAVGTGVERLGAAGGDIVEPVVDPPVGEVQPAPISGPEHRDEAPSVSQPAPATPNVPATPEPHERQQPRALSGDAVTHLASSAVSATPRDTVDERVPERRPAPALPPVAPTPASLPCGPDGYLATGHGSLACTGLVANTTQRAGLGESRVPSTRTAARALVNESRPQPGVTPD